MSEPVHRGRKCKLNQTQVQEIREYLQRGLSQRNIAQKYNISQMSVSKLSRGITHSTQKGIVIKDTRGIKVQL